MMGTRRIVVGIWGMVLLIFLLVGAAYPAIYFEMADPVGDENGYGSYQYPSNIAFKPYHGLFDIRNFKVWSEKSGEIYFDTLFQAAISNPWAAPEGFIHQNLRIFIDTLPNQGFTDLPQPGADVRFDPTYAWDVCLKVVGWANSQLLIADGKNVKVYPLKAETLGDRHTIRAKVQTELLGVPSKSWSYYVFVGSYDGFGPDFFRKVKAHSGEWVIGGGLDAQIEPLVMDLLAPPVGPQSQVKQLGSFSQATKELALLIPVGTKRLEGERWRKIAILTGAILLLLGLVVFVYWKHDRIRWFWVRAFKPGK